MHRHTAIEVDCSDLIPNCGMKCAKCFAEVRQVLTTLDGVSRMHIEQHRGERRLVVEHDPAVIGTGMLTSAVEKLPTFYAKCFQTKLVNI